MTPNTHALNDLQDYVPAKDWRRHPATRSAVFLLSWWACGLTHAVDFPSQPLQTGVVQPAPNVIFILDDSLSMTSVGGDALNTGLEWCANTTGNCPNSPSLGSGAGAPYTKNPLSYDPHREYLPWATSNTTDTSVVRLSNANFSSASSDLQLHDSGYVNLGDNIQTYYVPKTTGSQADQRNYYRYQLRSGGNRLVRSEWVNNNNTIANTVFSGVAVANGQWNTSGGSANVSTHAGFAFTVPARATQLTITTSGTVSGNRDPGIYVNTGANPRRTGADYARNAQGTGSHETLTINNPPIAQVLRIGVFNHGTQAISGLTITVVVTTTEESDWGCTVHATNYGWKNCTDVGGGDTTTGVREISAERQNYANWYQYHRTRMKTAKAGGSEAFSTLDENFRVGLMGLYPTGSNQQVLGGTTGGAAPTAANAGNLQNMIPVGTNGGLFIGNNRKNWFDHLHDMQGKNYTPLRKALNAAGRYYTTARAYQSTVGATTTYLACRQNFTILTTDGYWNNFNGTDDADSNYTSLSGDEEDGTTINGPNAQSYQYLRSAPYWYNYAGSDRSDGTTLADVAMHYWKTDLRTTDVAGYAGSADNRVPFSGANPAFWQHMVTFGVGLGVRGSLTEAQVAHAVAGTGTVLNGGFWPPPVHATGGTENPQNIDDLRHAAVNSRGSYINANDSEEFANGIADALSRIGERRGSASNVLANSTSISTESFVFQATYTAGSWRGELLAYPISSAGLGTPQWRASERMSDWDDRKIFTAGPTSGGSTFPNSTQLSALGTPATDLGLPNATALADYLKGDGSREVRNSGPLRNRATGPITAQIPTLLGDIVDSSPFFVQDTQTVFVGANDGMLHAFDATNATPNADRTTGGGTERFTYIPRGVSMSQLAELADPDYGTHPTNNPHRFFVDGPIVVSARSRTPGKNYLVGALGRGGNGVYGLDVTTPGSFSAGSVLWDNTGSAAPANMGNVISEPLISKLNTGVTAAVVANGPNSSTGTASLFFINLDTGATIHEIDTATTDNGLSAPRAVDVDADGLVDYFFAGDLQGNLWRFNVAAGDTASWTFDKVFTARDGGSPGNLQPISSAPGVARDPNTGIIWVFFGTGRYMTADDQASLRTHSYYGVMLGTDGSAGGNLTRADLELRTIATVDAATGYRYFEPASAAVDSTLNGWYLDLNNPANTGERVISAPLLYDNILVFSSIVPPSATTVNSCEAGGTGYVNALDAFSGRSLPTPFFDLANPVGSLPITAGMPTAPIIIGDKLVVGDSSGGTPTDIDVNAPGGTSTRRLSWRELLDLQ